MMKTLFRHVLGFGPSRKRLFEKLEESQKEAANANEFLNGYEGFMDRIDAQISESLEKIGELPGKPAGFPDRVDVACRLLEDTPNLKTEINRLRKECFEAYQQNCVFKGQRDDARREAKKAIEVADLREMGWRKKIRDAQFACEELRKKNKTLLQSNASQIENARTSRQHANELVDEAAEANMKLLLRNQEISSLKKEIGQLEDDRAGLNASLRDMKGLVDARDKEIAQLRLDLMVAQEKIRVFEHRPTLEEILNLMM